MESVIFIVVFAVVHALFAVSMYLLARVLNTEPAALALVPFLNAFIVASRVMKKSKMGRSGSSAGPISYLARQAKSTHVHQAAPLSGELYT